MGDNAETAWSLLGLQAVVSRHSNLLCCSPVTPPAVVVPPIPLSLPVSAVVALARPLPAAAPAVCAPLGAPPLISSSWVPAAVPAAVPALIPDAVPCYCLDALILPGLCPSPVGCALAKGNRQGRLD